MDKYLPYIKINSNQNSLFYAIDLNEEIKDKLIEDVTEIGFTNLYANLLIKFYENEIFSKNNINIDENIIERVKRFLYIRQGNAIGNVQIGTIEWKEWCISERVWVNRIYVEELKNQQLNIFGLYRQYMQFVFSDLLKYNPLTWLYYDTDHLFISGSNINEETKSILSQIAIPYEPIHHNFLYVSNLKQYITGNKAKIAERGRPIYKREDIIAIMKQKIRENKINDLFIE